ncbi:MAG: MFS transporter [Cytophagaceae bacterium]|nr:MAG: MFS transporter [Cytophagaceae bacterium]
MLPLDLTISDFGGTEKIVILPCKLAKLVRGAVPDPRAADLCYYVPWGSLAFFHGSYESIPDLVRLVRIDGGVQPLLMRGKFPVRIEAV